MVDQLRSFAAEVTRVAREVGTEGKLGGQADVQDVAGTWEDLTETVNFMAGEPPPPGRGNAQGGTAGAAGGPPQKSTQHGRGDNLAPHTTTHPQSDPPSH